MTTSRPPWNRLVFRSATTVTLAFALPTVLAGCETVAGAGSTGMSMDEGGHPVIVFALCNDYIDGATIYRDRLKSDPQGEHSSVSAADWEAASPVTPNTAAAAELNTANPSGSWSRKGPSEKLRPGVDYVAYGWTRDNSWFTGHVEFTLARVSKLKRGQVLTQTYVQATGKDVDTVQSYAQFKAQACSYRS